MGERALAESGLAALRAGDEQALRELVAAHASTPMRLAGTWHFDDSRVPRDRAGHGRRRHGWFDL